jgi:aryl-alcohol dehydrogenase-like predicted oxidoreductase
MPGATVQEIVRGSLDAGVDWFDTAEAYGRGQSEEALAGALLAAGREPGSVVVATKWFPIFRTAQSIRSTVEDRVAYLSPFPVDLHQIHAGFGALSSKGAQMKAMAELVESGRIRAVGVSNFSARGMYRSARVLEKYGLPLASNQVRYSLLDRGIERNGVLSAARNLGATIIAYSPLAQGILSGKFHREPEAASGLRGPRRFQKRFRRQGLERSALVVSALQEIADGRGVTPAQVALRWLLDAQGDLVVAIPGASNPEQARENAEVMGFELTDKEIRTLDRASRDFH